MRAGTRLATRALWRGGGRRPGGDTGPPGDGGQGALGAADQQRGLGAAGGRPRGRAQPHLVLHRLLRAPRFPGLFVSCGDNEGGSAPLHPPAAAAHPAVVQHPAPRGCRQKAALRAKRLLWSGSIQKSSMTSSGHQSQRKSPKHDIPQQNDEAWMCQSLPLMKMSPSIIETGHRHPHPQAAAGFGDAGTHRARCSDTGRACPGSAPACPSRPRPAP